MFAIERQNKIKEILLKDKRVDVFELSRLFSVTEVTIRRDLDKLEQEGFLTKTYGGAVLKENFANNSFFPDIEDDLTEEKKTDRKNCVTNDRKWRSYLFKPWFYLP